MTDIIAPAMQGVLDLGIPVPRSPADDLSATDRGPLLGTIVAIIIDLAHSRGRVTSDDVHDDPRVPDGVPDCAWGQAFAAAGRTGEVRLSGGWVRSTRPSRARGVQAVWVPTRRRGAAR